MRLIICLIFIVSFLPLAISQEFTTGNTATQPHYLYGVLGKHVRVRFFFTDGNQKGDLLQNSPAHEGLSNDETKIFGSPMSYFAATTLGANYIGFSEFSEDSRMYGLTVNIQAILCEAELFKTLQDVINSNPVLATQFTVFNIIEINLFLKTVMAPKKNDYKLEIAKISRIGAPSNAAALNIQVPYTLPRGECNTPLPESLSNYFNEAACKGGGGARCELYSK